ncbi:hypothetical protein GCM10022223_04300 [Kineosporia mesophila]|uniref:Dynamin N-terminal domain-containing protein n=1 Tax=Kineosporia mesophila TaxID=566012 RepID=A0ABP6YYI2_9ACTN
MSRVPAAAAPGGPSPETRTGTVAPVAAVPADPAAPVPPVADAETEPVTGIWFAPAIGRRHGDPAEPGSYPTDGPEPFAGSEASGAGGPGTLAPGAPRGDAPAVAAPMVSAPVVPAAAGSSSAAQRSADSRGDGAASAAVASADSGRAPRSAGASSGSVRVGASGAGSGKVPGGAGRGAAGRGSGGDKGNGPGAGNSPLPKRLAAVERLRTQVATLSLTLDVEGAAAVRKEREDLLSQLDDYILPRLQRPDAPALAVIGGSTGAGKSTLTNSIVGREVTRSGVLRPTTRSPVLVHHPIDSGAFLSQRILPRLTRVTSEAAEPLQPIDPNAPRITGLRLVPYDGLAPGLALLDAPDIDSLVETNRDLAVQLLQAADLWIFVTTAARYADAMPWEMLKQAADRGAAIAVVLDRVPPEALQELRIHLATKLRDRGLGGAALFTVPEAALENGFLPVDTVKPLRDWLRRIAGDDRSRSVVVERTLNGALRSLPARARTLAKAAAAQADGWSQLYEEIDGVMIPARFAMLDGLADGSLMSGQVLSHWQEFIARGDLASRLGGTTTNRAQRLGAALTQPDQDEASLATTIGEAVTASVQHSVRTAMEQVLATWRGHTYGVSLLTARGHQVAPADPEKLLAKPVGEWREKVTQRTTEALAKARRERPDLKVDEQAVIDVVFALAVTPDAGHDASGKTVAKKVRVRAGLRAGASETAESTDVEAPAGTPGSTVGARLAVEELLGEDVLRSILEAARTDLVMRSATVIDDERLRLERVLENPEDLGLRVGALLDAASAVNIAE